MSTITVSDIPLESTNPAQRLRGIAAAVRVAFTWPRIHELKDWQNYPLRKSGARPRRQRHDCQL